MGTFSQRIDARLAAPGRGPFLVVDGKATDHAAFAGRLRRCFALFAGLGLRPGDRVGLISTDVLDVATLMLAGIRAGLAMVNLNPEMGPRDCAVALAACRLAHVFVDADIAARLVLPQGLAATLLGGAAEAPRAAGLLGRLRGRTAAGPAGLDAELARVEPADPPAPVAADATAMMLFTSGTTSAPKVVELSHGNLAAQFAAFDAVYDYDMGSRILNPLPLHFTDGMLHGPMAAFLAGGALHRPRRFDFQKLEDLVHGIYRDRITHFIVVPALLSMLDRLGDAFADAFDAPDFRYIRSSGDLLPEVLWRAIETRFRVRVANTYGMSETVCEATYAGPDPATLRIGTIGRPVGCEVRIVGDDGGPVEPGATGELLIRGPIIMKGYLGEPELTAGAFADGWLRTGDFARADADGFVTIVGRKKALIISGGINVQPQDITDCLLGHPAVAEAVTFGVPHAMFGEAINAAVRLRDGAAATSRALIGHCEAELSPHKVPRAIAIVAELPRNAAGKVLVEVLRGQVAALDTSVGSASDASVLEQVVGIAARVFGVAPAELRATSEPATTLGWDSLAHLDMIAAVEAHFGVALSAGDVLRVHALGDLVAIVNQKRAG